MFSAKFVPRKDTSGMILQYVIIIVMAALILDISVSLLSLQNNLRICATPPISCNASKYRSYDGTCNNLLHPYWGATNTRYNRLLPANYGDGKSSPSVSQDGCPLPNAREVSYTVYPDKLIKDIRLNVNTLHYGQLLVHDMSMSSTQAKPEADRCCSVDGKLLAFATNPDYCFPIILPLNDPVYSNKSVKCFAFDRTGTDLSNGCGDVNKPVQQISRVNHFVDLSLVYGNNDRDNKAIRLFIGGKLRFEERNGQKWLPRNPNPVKTCILVNPNEPCYLTGDIRGNQNPQLVVLHTILLREHNRIAEALAKLNPKWNDEKLFQEARKINIGQHQKIVYYDLLPNLIGKTNMLKRKLIYEKKGYVDDYNASVNPSVLNEHATAAFRFFHSTLVGSIDLVNEIRKTKSHLKVSDNFNRPLVVEEKKDNFDDLARGLVTQRQLRADEYHDRELTNNWGKLPGRKIGQDLKALCIQRGRDHGLATYNDFREYCGLPRAKKFSDFLDVISKKNVKKLESLYKTPEDVEATVGGSLEKLVPETTAGPTFGCIITEQFYRTRVGDRFFFENSGETGFSLKQLKEIRKASVSRLICDNTDVKFVQRDGFAEISLSNSVLPCSSLPSVDLSLWKE